MRVLVTGAYGFIGSHVLARLAADGHELIGVGRRVGEAARRFPNVRWVPVDFAQATRPEDWSAHLAGIDAVVNCVGVLQSAPGQTVEAIQVDGTVALFEACARAGVRRVVHLSAVGVDQERPTEFSRTKRSADAALMALPLDWVILRPSVVVGRAAYGGSALFRGLAGLPGFLPVVKDAGPLDIVQADDVAATVAFFLKPDTPARRVLELVGPQRLSFTEVVLAYRRWLGLPPPRLVPLPGWLAHVAFRLGDFVGWLGWRPPLRSTAEREVALGATGDGTQWRALTGIEPHSLAEALAAEPASVQERWFARLYLLKPLIFGVLSLFWIGTGIMSLGPGYHIGEQWMHAGGVEGPLAVLAIVAGGLTDLVLGIGMAIRRTARLALIGSLIVSVAYFAIGTYLLPGLWLDPLGPMMKIWPICGLALVALAIYDDR
jgi:uncharacterized protein YbjT (DUF2867 family)